MSDAPPTLNDYLGVLRKYRLKSRMPRRPAGWPRVSRARRLRYHRAVKKRAEELLNTKLCRCMHRLGLGTARRAKRAAAICTKSIFNKREIFRRGRFTCRAPQGTTLRFVQKR